MAASSWSTCQLSAFITAPLLPQGPRGSKPADSRYYQQLHLIILNTSASQFPPEMCAFIYLFFVACRLVLIAPQDSEAQLLNVSNYNRAEREARLEMERQRVYLACDREEQGEKEAGRSLQSVFGSCGSCFWLLLQLSWMPVTCLTGWVIQFALCLCNISKY